ncbi:MAG: iron-sulfur cluster assembly accessory protein [Verrucomicrobia bacterium]|nr:iron-sulfur cluster assembly accessory protein [Verrucomicrobiota bacterium]
MTVAPPQPGDHSLEQNGARLFMAADSIHLLDGCTLDYEEELTHTGFKIVNPKAKQTCGCGTSFEA